MTPEDLKFLRDKFNLKNVEYWMLLEIADRKGKGSDFRNLRTRAYRDALRFARYVLNHPFLRDRE
jgi:hypothetical protein